MEGFALDREDMKVNSDARLERKRKKKPKYKSSRVIIVVVALVIAVFAIFWVGKTTVKLFAPKDPAVEMSKNEEKITRAKEALGENIIYVTASFEDSDGSKYKGIAFLNVTDFMFIGDKGFEKRISLDYMQDVAVSDSGKDYDISITDEDGSIYKLSKIEKSEDADGFIIILTR